MEIEFKDSTIRFSKELNNIDKFVVRLIPLFRNIKYVIISGYVALLFGRNRTTEDVDVFIEKISLEEFKTFFNGLKGAGYWAVNGDDVDELYGMLKDKLAIRIAEYGKAMPNFEIKFFDGDIDRECLDRPNKVVLNEKYDLFISPFEIAIAFKLKLGTDKDYEDARFLYKLFEDKLDIGKFDYYLDLLKVRDKLRFVE